MDAEPYSLVLSYSAAQSVARHAVLAKRLCELGIENPPANPLAAAQEGWLLGGDDEFIARIKRLLKPPRHSDEVPQWKHLELSAAEVVQAVAEFYGSRAESYCVRRSQAPGRDLAAYRAHRRTTATLRERSWSADMWPMRICQRSSIGIRPSTSNCWRMLMTAGRFIPKARAVARPTAVFPFIRHVGVQ